MSGERTAAQTRQTALCCSSLSALVTAALTHVNISLWSGLRLKLVVSEDFPIMEKTFRAKVRREGRP